MQNSFYGGQPGVSFIIVTYYETVDEMIENFKKGPDYEAVHFDEHVLINTFYKDDPDNGKIYRRGYDYTNDMGGAVYVGTIVGPPGHSPMVEMTTVADVIEKYDNEEHDEHILSEGEYAPLYDLVPGKTDDGEYRDSIKWACCSIHNKDHWYTTAYIGFIWPYLVVDYEADSVSPYYNRNSDEAGFTNTNLVDRMDDESHPFWEKWHINVPKGIKGDTFENFRVITASDDDGVESYDGQADDRAHNREILVYDYYHFDKEEGGEPVTIYLGDYNMITGITILDDGTITIEYSHDDDTQYVNLFKWIKEITLDTTNGHFTIIYNYDTEADGTPTKYETDLAWVSAITMTHEGKVTIHHITGDQEDLDEVIQWVDAVTLDENGTLEIQFNTGDVTTWSNVLKWITSVELTDEGHFTISFNNGDDAYETDLVWVREITFEEDGIVTVIYNNGQQVTYPNIKWITEISLAEDGSFHIGFNNGDEYNTNLVWATEVSFDEQGIVTVHFNNGTTQEYPNIKWINDVNINIGDIEGTGNQKVHIKYNTGEEEDIGEPLNYIMRMEMVESNYHLLVWYSDPAKRQEIIDEGKSYVFDGEDGWLDLGSVKDESGILIGTNYDYDVPLEITQDVLDEIAGWLDTTYPNGLEGTDLQGKVITVGNDNTDNKLIYAYDYDLNTWYYIGSLGDTIKPEQVILFDTEAMTKTDTLRAGGAFFVLEDYSIYG